MARTDLSEHVHWRLHFSLQQRKWKVEDPPGHPTLSRKTLLVAKTHGWDRQSVRGISSRDIYNNESNNCLITKMTLTAVILQKRP